MLKEILKILEGDARTTAKQIAAMTNTSSADVSRTIRRAEKEQIILKYKAVINWDKVEDEWVWALIEVKVIPQKDVGFNSIAERIYRFPQARSVYLASGDYDLVVLVLGKTEHDVADFVAQKLATIDGVQGSATHFILKRYKEDGEILVGKEELKRQPVTL